MSNFITRDDYRNAIRDNRLDAITEFDDNLLGQSEERAISFVKSYLSARYDTTNIFNKSGAQRDPMILGITLDVALYYLHRAFNPRKVPDFRKEAYEDAKEWLEGVRGGTINPEALPLPDDDTKQYITWGSNTKRENHI